MNISIVGQNTESSLKKHLLNKSNPHGITIDTIGAAKAEHSHTSNQLTTEDGTDLLQFFSNEIGSIFSSSKAYTDEKIAALVNSAPETLDTLGELATALNENKNVTDVLNAAITNKADKEHEHAYLPLSGGTITGDIIFDRSTVRSSVFPCHYYHQIYGTNDRTTYVHAYPSPNSVSEGATRFDFRVANGNGGFDTLSERGGDGVYWNGSKLLDTGNYKSYCTPANIGAATASHTHTYSDVGAAAASHDHPHNHDQLQGWMDTRNVITKPNDYNHTLKCVGIKTSTATGTIDGSAYSTLVGVRGWSDSSGGNSHEIAFTGNGKLYQRHGSTETWGAWNQILSSANFSLSGSTLYITTT